MKIALYIEDGLEQIVLTPETETEESILSKFHDGERELKILRGGFYNCNGGWTRQRDIHYSTAFGGNERKSDESTIILLEKREIEPNK